MRIRKLQQTLHPRVVVIIALCLYACASLHASASAHAPLDVPDPDPDPVATGRSAGGAVAARAAIEPGEARRPDARDRADVVAATGEPGARVTGAASAPFAEGHVLRRTPRLERAPSSSSRWGLSGEGPLVGRYDATKPGFAVASPHQGPPALDGGAADAEQAHVAAAGLAQAAQTRCAQETLDLAATPLSGELATPDCRWGQVTGTQIVSYVDQYRFELSERGSLRLTGSADFDLYLSLHDAGYGPLRDAFSSEGSAAELEITLPAGDYVLLVTPLSDEPDIGGAYELQAELSPAAPATSCDPLPLAAGAGSTRALAEDGCRVFDWLPGVLLDFPAHLYLIELSEPGTLSGRITSGELDVRHSLLDDEGRTLSADLNVEDDPEPGASELELRLAAGTYRMLVLGAAGGTGDYSLTTSFDTAGEACRAVPVEATSTTAASLSDDDCADAWLDNGISVGAPLDLYELVLTRDGRLDITVDATGWAPILWLLDLNDRVFLGQATSPPLGLNLPPGTYHLAIQSADNGRGDYELGLDFAPVNPTCVTREIEPNGFVTGDLAATACQLREYYFGTSEDPVDPYLLRLEQRGELTIDLRSDEFDTFLALLAGPTPSDDLNISGAFTLDNDNDFLGGDTNSQIRAVLPAGDYLILATNFEGAGAYQLTTAFTASPAPTECPIVDLALDAPLTAELDGLECTASDLDPYRLVWSPVDRYRVRAPGRGQVSIALSSGAYFPRLRLFDAQTGALVGDDYDTEFNSPLASLDFFTDAREYIVAVESVSDAQYRGEYEIRASFTAAPDDDGCRETVLPAPGSVQGVLESNDCTWPEVPGGLGIPAGAAPPVDVYRTTLAQVGLLSATVRANVFRPYVELLSQRRNLLGGEGPVSIGLPAELAAGLGPGDYYLYVLSQDIVHDAYDIELDFAPAPFDPDAEPATPTPPAATPTATTPPLEPTPSTAGGRLYVPWTGKQATLGSP